MAKDLNLVAYSEGRSPLPAGDQLTLVVDADNPVVVEVSPDPSTWLPEDLALYCGDTEVVSAPLGDGRRWVLTGADRFGTFRACASAGVSIIESPETVVVPAPAPALEPATAPAPASQHAQSASGSATPVTEVPVAPDPVELRPAAPGAHTTGPAPSTGPADPAGPPETSGQLASPSSGAAPDPAPVPPSRPQSTQSLAPPAGPAAPAPRGAAVELPAGEYDARFAAWVGVIFVALSAVVLGFILVQVIGQLDATITTDPDTGTTIPESAAGRAGLATSALLVGISCILFLAGAALAALEVRARQRRDPGPTAAVRGAPGTREKMSVILEQSTRLRAPVALLVTGAAVLGVAVLSQIHWADHLG